MDNNTTTTTTTTNNNNNNFSYPNTYPDSNTSTPRSRELDCETYDEQHPNPNPNYKVKLMCSYGGKILPRPHDNQLTYIGGDTKILTVDRNIRYASIFHKLNSLTGTPDICFKYQLPGEDLDALISVTNDEDLEHMMTEYDRIFRSSVKPVRLRLFMFPLIPSASATATALGGGVGIGVGVGGGGGGGGGESKTEQQWFVDALNAVQISSASPASENPDYMFGFDKGNANVNAIAIANANVNGNVNGNGNAPALKVQDVVVAQEGDRAGSECGSEDSNSKISDPVVSPTVDVHRQMQESQRIQIAAGHEQAISIDPRAYYGDYYKIQQTRYWQEQRHMTTGGYQMAVPGTDPPVYLIPSSTGGVYPAAPGPVPAGAAVRPAPQVSQGQAQAYYGMQRMVNPPPEMYREQPVYCTMTQQTQAQIQQPKVGTYHQEAIGIVRPQGEIGGYAGQVYYANTNSQGGIGPAYQPVIGPGLAVNQEGKMVMNPNKVL